MTMTDFDRITAALAPASPLVVSDRVVDDLIDELCRLHRSAALGFALTVGRLVLDRLYGGDLDAWRARGDRSDSFRKLAAKLDPLGIPGLTSSALSRAVATVELDARVGVAGRPQLTRDHVVAVLGLDPATQERLLGEAEALDMTAAELRQEAQREKRKLPGARPGRKPLPAFVKTLNRWERELDEDAAFADLDQVGALDSGEAERLVAAVEKMRARCEQLLGTLRSAG